MKVNTWEKKIIDEFISHYFSSRGEPSRTSVRSVGVPASETEENRTCLRLRSSVLFPDFDSVHHGDKESYIDAAKSLEQKGIVNLNWEKWNRDERLKTLSCENFEKLFEEAGRPYPKTEAEKTRTMIGIRTEALRESLKAASETKEAAACDSAQSAKVIALLEFLANHFGPRDIGQGIDKQTMEELVRLLEFLLNPSRFGKITTRSLSILLYRDSKRLENLLALLAPLLSRAQKSVSVPDLSFLERSFPEIMIAGKININFKNTKTPMVNAGGYIMGLPFESAKEIESIQLASDKKEKTVLTIENKETFYALASPQKHEAGENLSRFDCFLYVGGYSNRAAAVLINILASSGFSFYHAGDLDPDGILILQNIQDIAKKPVTPIRMDTATFNQYRPWARSLTKPMLRQIEKINEETRAIYGITDLLQIIKETALGIEQEIIDYR